ncbi:type II toxin-antitoxin system VapC family toxin [Tsukamurella asaccharolytica]|uniref:Type II toxin-antitoxin system VapC family toxin n=1 Tax=Tsukamurella asaccharolytica TaxID=2592067 RepID=A0A5C5R678_9ACTN|nr:type II toxin-antitoxin system VapC family toxin [Tsukamurella asaccharolytica]TWS17833.1 type II toxin-antitoxin system VapC family toxin [Tsukamurella asaccharolytica]
MEIGKLCGHDIVLDTNVLSHAENSTFEHHDSAKCILEWMRGSSTLWVVDNTGKSKPDPKTSLLFAEYRATLQPMGAPLQLFTMCLLTGRVVFAERPNQANRSRIRKLIPRNNKDQAVLGAALDAEDQVLVSNDLDDFSPNVRDTIRKVLGVNVVHTQECSTE